MIRLMCILVSCVVGSIGKPEPGWAQHNVPLIELNIAEEARFPVDLGLMNHRPAGRLGRVRAKGDSLVFADGSPARFWGVNLQAYALFRSSEAQIAFHADRLARMGVNLVRLHHHDSHWVEPNIFGLSDTRDAYISPSSMAKLDLWIAKLRAQGIYIWLDLHVGRRITARDPQGTNFNEIINGGFEGDLRGYNYINDDVKSLMQDFTTQYLTHVNPHTGLAYKDDPAIAAVLITNENDLTQHYAAKLLAENGAPGHERHYRSLAKDFAQDRGGDPNQIWHFWEWGPSKLFIADLEHRFYADMSAHLRGLGYEGLIAASNFWGGTPLAVLPPLTAGDLIDVHSYGQDGDIGLDPVQEADMLANIASGHVTGMPLSVSEWNIETFGSPDRLFAPLRVASMAAFQGWDAMMLYGYAQRPLQPGDVRLDKWHNANDPNLIATLPAAALLYRMEHVAPARLRYILRPDGQTLFGSALTASTLPALRYLPERAQVSIALPSVVQLPWLSETPVALDAIELENLQDLPSSAQQTNTAPFRRHHDRGLFTLDSKQSKVVAGHLNKEHVSVTGLDVALAHDRAVVALQSVSEAGVTESDQLLISVALPGYTQKEMALPFVSEPLNGTLTFTARSGLRLRNIEPQAGTSNVMHHEMDGRHVVSFQNAPGALWVVLER